MIMLQLVRSGPLMNLNKILIPVNEVLCFAALYSLQP